MSKTNKKLASLLLLVSTLPLAAAPRIVTGSAPSPREQYAAAEIREAAATLPGSTTIVLARLGDPVLTPYAKDLATLSATTPEAFALRRSGSTLIVAGSDASGVLYGALDLASRVRTKHSLPEKLSVDDLPHLKLRGAVIGMQKPEITYDGAEYDYRYTPEDFPFFYDKAAWTKYLDLLAANRYNALYLWNGHPFTSLLKLPKYPEAQELTDEQLNRNIEIFRWLTAEADKRGIWVIQGFYNIHLSHKFAAAHHLPNHLSSPTPEATAYTRYAISEFIREYPSVGLLITLGEAMAPRYGAQWMTEAVIPGVKDGVAEQAKALGHPVPEPPIIVRRHATDIDAVMAASRPLYSNIETMFKWNGESLTSTDIRGPVLKQFTELIPISRLTIVNVHLLSNLEPFRWASPDYIQKTEQSFERIGITGLHLYPLRFWEWPVSADRTAPLLQQTDRDWLWYEAWARYAWNPNRDTAAERDYWISRLAAHYGSRAAAAHILDAYQLSGPAAPTILARLGITEGNRQTLSLGMTMPQLIDPNRFGAIESLWTGNALDGERLDEYVANELAGKPHHGDTPLSVTAQAEAATAHAIQEAEAASPAVTANRDEYLRLTGDMRSIHAMSAFYKAKTLAAEQVLLYAHDSDLARLDKAEAFLAQSVEAFRQLTALAQPAYRDAAALHTPHRRIPVVATPKTLDWAGLLLVYEKELATFRKRLVLLHSGASTTQATASQLPQAAFALESGGETFTVSAGAPLGSSPKAPALGEVPPELDGLTGIRPTGADHTLHFKLTAPAQILLALIPGSGSDRGFASEAENWNLLYPEAIPLARGRHALSVWTQELPAGPNDLNLGKTNYVVLGFVPSATHLAPHAAPSAPGSTPNLDWLFE
ncbi:MAG: hypothetical protein P4L03_04340 [Terracidiphilus sp.]|nr:hypothetical protein [Terracidiphilus sp.]